GTPSRDLSTSVTGFPHRCNSPRAPSRSSAPTTEGGQLTTRTRILSLALLAGVVAVSSALAGRSDTTFTVASSIDGTTVLPLRSPWIASPNDTQSIDHVDFFIDGYHAWTQHQAPWYFGGQGNWLITTFLKPGMHKFVVRAYDAANQMAVDTVQARVVGPPA